MTEDVKLQLEMTDDSMKDTVAHLNKELSKLRAGKASPAMLDGIKVDYYGTLTPLKQVANVGTQDASTIVVQPWEKSMTEVIDKEIMKANLGFNPVNKGDILIINVPPLTEERRIELAKQVKSAGETGKISIRNARREAMDSFKQMKDQRTISIRPMYHHTNLSIHVHVFTCVLGYLLDTLARKVLSDNGLDLSIKQFHRHISKLKVTEVGRGQLTKPRRQLNVIEGDTKKLATIFQLSKFILLKI